MRTCFHSVLSPNPLTVWLVNANTACSRQTSGAALLAHNPAQDQAIPPIANCHLAQPLTHLLSQCPNSLSSPMQQVHGKGSEHGDEQKASKAVPRHGTGTHPKLLRGYTAAFAALTRPWSSMRMRMSSGTAMVGWVSFSCSTVHKVQWWKRS